MNTDDMSYEQLVELAQAKAPDQDDYRIVDVDGLTVRIDERAAKSWKTVSIISEIGESLTPQSLRKIPELIAFITDVDESRLLEACGGEMAAAEDVIGLATKIIGACVPKN